MPRRVALAFETVSPADASRFLDEYVLDAVERIRGLDACDSITFVPGQPLDGDRTAGLQVPPPDHAVYLTIRGETDAIVDRERDRWEDLVDAGVITNWTVQKSTERSEMVDRLGEERTSFLAAQSDLAARMAAVAFEDFVDRGRVPAAIETFSEERAENGTDAAPFGWWMLLHTLTVQLNYSIEEELDAYTYCIEHALRNIAEFEGPEAAAERLDEVCVTLRAKSDEVQTGRLDA